MYSGGSLQTVEIAGSEYQAAVHSGPGCGSAAVIQSRNVRRGHRDGDSIQRDKQYIDNMAVTKCVTNDPRGSAFIQRCATRRVITCDTSESSWSRSLVTIKSLRPAVHRNVSKFGAMGRWACSPKWPHGYRSQIAIPSVRRI